MASLPTAVDVARANPYHIFVSILLISMVTIIAFFIRQRNPEGLPLPPGPKGYAIIGNLFDIPTDKPWLVFHEWSKIYGDMVYFKVFGHSFLVLHSFQRTRDLFDKRSFIYSDRPRLPMLVELMGWDYNLAFMPYGTLWRQHRQFFREHFHTDAIPKYSDVQTLAVRSFLKRLLLSPENLKEHIRHLLADALLNIIYGIKIKESNDPYVHMIDEALTGINEAGIPGNFLVDQIPLLKYVPAWFPGAGFKRKAAHWRKATVDSARVPFRCVKEQVASGVAPPSIVSDALSHLSNKDEFLRAEEENILEGAASTAFAGGADTTFSALQFFFLAMAMYPEVQQKAQSEIDEAVGPSRLPQAQDRASLPYINAIVKETLRWQLVAPLAPGHASSKDDEYNGYFIPKGTIVIGNSWALLHDDAVFPDPFEFKPERYLKGGQLDSDAKGSEAAFGFGRRICPGRFLSENSLYVVISSVLAVYDIRPPVDEQGTPKRLTTEVTTSLVSCPHPFECIIKPRSQTAESLVYKYSEGEEKEY